ncbi:hypothetical protein HK405_008398, partial [Cladochytrium tenue]
MADAQPQMSLFAVTANTATEPARPWKAGLFGCFSDCGTCLVAYYCPCFVFGQNMERIGAGKSGCCMYCLALTFTGGIGNLCLHTIGRGNLRAKYNIE